MSFTCYKYPNCGCKHIDPLHCMKSDKNEIKDLLNNEEYLQRKAELLNKVQASREVLQVQKQLKKEQIVDAVSRFIKDTPNETTGGMMEVPYRWIGELEKLLYQLQKIENQLADVGDDHTNAFEKGEGSVG